jgi:hypothetical protein
MRTTRTSWIRGAVTLGVLGALTAGVLISPVNAAANLTRAKVKNIAEAAVKRVGKDLFVTKGLGRYAENNPAAATPLSNNVTNVLDLAATAQQLTLTSSQTVFASAVVRARNDSANANGLTCDIKIAGQDGQNSGVNTPAVNNFDVTIPLAESATLGAGTHNVTVECTESAADMVYLSGQLQVWVA